MPDVDIINMLTPQQAMGSAWQEPGPQVATPTNNWGPPVQASQLQTPILQPPSRNLVEDFYGLTFFDFHSVSSDSGSVSFGGEAENVYDELSSETGSLGGEICEEQP